MKILGYDINFKKTPIIESPRNEITTGRKNPKIIEIVQNFKDNSRKDIDKWRKALVLASHPEEPKMYLLYDLIDDLKTDGHLQSQIQMRKTATMNTDFQIINRKTGETNEELTFIFQQQWFYEFLDYALDSILYGTSLVEFINFNAEKIQINLIPRRNVVPQKHRIYPDVTKDNFIDYNNPLFAKWLISIGKNGDFGIINNIIPNIIWKRNVMQSWAEFCEKFGLPLITATTNTSDATVIDNVNTMLLSLGEAGAATFPHGTDIKFQEANRTDAYQVYKQFMQTNADEISKQLVGSTMLSDQGSNRSQTEVHERTLDDKISQADKRNITFIVNDWLLPLLQMQGYRVSPDDVYEFKTAEQEMDLDKLWSITSGLLSNGFDVEQDWISKTFNIPLGAKKKIQSVTKPELNTAAAYLDIEPEERYPFSCTCGNHVVAVGNRESDNIDEFSKQLARYVFDGKDTLGIEAGLISEESKILLNALRGNFKTFNKWEGSDHLALQMMEYNLFEFAAGKTESRLASMIELLVNPETKELRDFPSFRVECDKVMKNYNHNWLETEYNLSVAVGQNSASFVQFIAEKDSVTPFVQYQTAGDSNVRNSHRALNGKVFSLNDKQAMDLWPPNGYGCRCEMIQFLGDHKDKLTSGSTGKGILYQADEKYQNSQFEINRGDLKQVFTKKQFYHDTKKLPEKLNEMTFDKYLDFDGKPLLKPWEDFKEDLKPLDLDKSITEENVGELFKKVKDKDYMGFSDYLGRKMTLEESVFVKHVSEKKYLTGNENRPQLFPYVKEILKNPDEVWYYDVNNDVKDKNLPAKFQARYISFYQDKIIVVETVLDSKQGLKINTWYEWKRPENELRKGLKIK